MIKILKNINAGMAIFHVRGYKLFKDYYYKSNCTLTPDTHFKKMLSAAVKTTEKDSSNER